MSRLDDIHARRGAASGVVQEIVAAGARRLAALGRSLSRRKEIYDLGRLDDRALADMGLTRSDVVEASRWSLWGEPAGRLAELGDGRRGPRLG